MIPIAHTKEPPFLLLTYSSYYTSYLRFKNDYTIGIAMEYRTALSEHIILQRRIHVHRAAIEHFPIHTQLALVAQLG